MLLDLDVVLPAARDLLIAALRDEIEDRDSNLELPDDYRGNPEGFADHVINKEKERILFIMGKYVGQIGAAWRNDVGLVFHHMGISDSEQITVLYRLIMSCWGHGIGIGDDHDKEFQKAKEVLDKYHPDQPMKESPTHFDQHESFTGPVIYPHLVEVQD